MALQLDVSGRVELGGETWRDCRLLVDHTNRAAVWQRGPGGLVWSGRATTATKTAVGGTVETADGTVLTATREGCGCRTQLTLIGESDLAALDVPA